MIAKKKTKRQKNPKGYWKDKADMWFSRYIRRKYADWRGNSKCVTCGIEKEWFELQCGHYESRGEHSVRFDERNAHPQCYACNCLRHGNYPRYAIFMLDTYGEEALKQLEKDAKKLIQYTAKDYQEIAENYKEKFNLFD